MASTFLFTLLGLIAVYAIYALANNGKRSTTPKEPLKGRLLAFADLHSISRAEWDMIICFDYDRVDAVVLQGDICRAYAERIRRIVPPHVPVLYVLGNHDGWNEYDGLRSMTNLDGRVVTVNNIRMAGMAGSTRYKPDSTVVMRSQKEAKKIMGKLPAADVLITHASPYHMLADDDAHEGFRAISRYIAKRRPAYHLFGHHHIDHKEKTGSTTCICVFGCAVINVGTGKTTKIF